MGFGLILVTLCTVYFYEKGEIMGSRLTDEFVERVRSESDLISVVSSYVQLKRKGNNYWGCCPFHQEDTPSFSVKADGSYFYCFGCHAGGNVFKFLSLIESVTYYEAILMQAERLNIPVPQREKTPEELAREKKIADMREVHEAAGRFFFNCLTVTDYGIPGREYYHNRGITDEIIKEFHLGYAPDAWDKLSSSFANRGFSLDLLQESGLAVKRNQGDGVYDRFRGRVMIPITDERGRVCGFGGRVIGDGQPKYLNSPETLLFNKRRLLFGLDKAHRAISQEGFSLVVEGYMDVISVYAAGVKNVVASLGTAFTEEQCKKLLRYAPAIYFCYDSDRAGQEAIARAIEISGKTNGVVKVVQLPDGKDPDEYIRKHGVEAFRHVVKAAISVVEFRLKHILSHSDVSGLEGRLRAMGEMLPVLGSIKNAAEQSAYISRVSQLLSISEGDIIRELSRNGRGDAVAVQAAPIRRAVRQVDDAVRRAGRVILRTVWEEPAVIEHLSAMVPLDSLTDTVHRAILQEISARYTQGISLKDVMELQQLGDEAVEEMSRALVEDLGGQDLVTAYGHCVNTLRKNYLNSQYEMHRLNADRLYRDGDEAYKNELAMIQKIKNEMDELQGVTTY